MGQACMFLCPVCRGPLVTRGTRIGSLDTPPVTGVGIT